MASTPKFVHILLMLMLLCLTLVPDSSECNNGNGCFYVKAVHALGIRNRKGLYGLHGPASSNGGVYGYGYGDQSVEEWELRRVPSGPDPLHHNGANPKKPRNTP